MGPVNHFPPPLSTSCFRGLQAVFAADPTTLLHKAAQVGSEFLEHSGSEKGSLDTALLSISPDTSQTSSPVSIKTELFPPSANRAASADLKLGPETAQGEKWKVGPLVPKVVLTDTVNWGQYLHEDGQVKDSEEIKELVKVFNGSKTTISESQTQAFFAYHCLNRTQGAFKEVKFLFDKVESLSLPPRWNLHLSGKVTETSTLSAAVDAKANDRKFGAWKVDTEARIAQLHPDDRTKIQAQLKQWVLLCKFLEANCAMLIPWFMPAALSRCPFWSSASEGGVNPYSFANDTFTVKASELGSRQAATEENVKMFSRFCEVLLAWAAGSTTTSTQEVVVLEDSLRDKKGIVILHRENYKVVVDNYHKLTGLPVVLADAAVNVYHPAPLPESKYYLIPTIVLGLINCFGKMGANQDRVTYIANRFSAALRDVPESPDSFRELLSLGIFGAERVEKSERQEYCRQLLFRFESFHPVWDPLTYAVDRWVTQLARFLYLYGWEGSALEEKLAASVRAALKQEETAMAWPLHESVTIRLKGHPNLPQYVGAVSEEHWVTNPFRKVDYPLLMAAVSANFNYFVNLPGPQPNSLVLNKEGKAQWQSSEPLKWNKQFADKVGAVNLFTKDKVRYKSSTQAHAYATLADTTSNNKSVLTKAQEGALGQYVNKYRFRDFYHRFPKVVFKTPPKDLVNLKPPAVSDAAKMAEWLDSLNLNPAFCVDFKATKAKYYDKKDDKGKSQ